MLIILPADYWTMMIGGKTKIVLSITTVLVHYKTALAITDIDIGFDQNYLSIKYSLNRLNSSQEIKRS